jgi:hypothetical protein
VVRRRVTGHVADSGGELTVTDEFRVTCHEIAPADYPAFRDKTRDAFARMRDDIILEKAGSSRARRPRR